MDRALLEEDIATLNQRFSLQVVLTDTAYAHLQHYLRGVAGLINADIEPVSRRDLNARLKQLHGHTSGLVELLRPVQPGIVLEEPELQFAQLLWQVVSDHHEDMTANEAWAQLDGILRSLEQLELYCDRAAVTLKALNSESMFEKGLSWPGLA